MSWRYFFGGDPMVVQKLEADMRVSPEATFGAMMKMWNRVRGRDVDLMTKFREALKNYSRSLADTGDEGRTKRRTEEMLEDVRFSLRRHSFTL